MEGLKEGGSGGEESGEDTVSKTSHVYLSV